MISKKGPAQCVLHNAGVGAMVLHGGGLYLLLSDKEVAHSGVGVDTVHCGVDTGVEFVDSPALA